MSVVIPFFRAGELDTISNLGAGQGVFAQIINRDARLKSITVSGGVSISATATEIDISSFPVLDEDDMVSDSNVSTSTQQSIKAYVDAEILAAITSDMTFKGDYNADTNTPDLDSAPAGVEVGDTYATTVAGVFFTQPLDVGDLLIAKQSNPTLLIHWTIVERNLDGAVTAGAVINDHAIVRGDGGSQGVQGSGVIIDDANNITGVNDLTVGGELIPAGGAGTETIMIGAGATAVGNSSTVMGENASSGGIDGVVIGNAAASTGARAVIIGNDAVGSTFDDTVVLGDAASVTGADGVALGQAAIAGFRGTAIGMAAQATGDRNVALGHSAVANSGVNSVAVGYQAIANGSSTVAFGKSAAANSTNSIAVGSTATVNADNSVALGYACDVSALSTIGIGRSATVTHEASIALGRSATSTAVNQFVIGAAGFEINEIRSINTGTLTLDTLGNFAVKLGDAAGSDKFRVLDNVDVEQFAVDSNGNLTLAGTVDGIDIATDVAANTAKVTNATHTGEVTGSGVLTAHPTMISNKALVTPVASDMLLVEDATDGLLKKVDASNFLGSGFVSGTSGAGAPVSTPATVNDLYTDTTNDDAYIGTDTISSADWDLIVTGAAGAATVTNSDQILFLDATDSSRPKTDTPAGVFLAGAANSPSTASFVFVIDEDNMVSDTDTKVPTQQSVKAYVDTEIAAAITSDMTFKGDYNADTNTPDLDSAPSGISIGDTYVTTAAGNFFAQPLDVGDLLIAKQDNPTLVTHWSIVERNLDGAVTAGAVIADNALTRGDGGAQGVQGSNVIVDDSGNMSGIGNISLSGTVDGIDIATDVAANTAKITYPSADSTKVAFISVTQAVDLDTMESDIATNNAKVTNFAHTGDVTGATALTAQSVLITGKPGVTVASGDLVLVADITDSNNLKQVTAQSIADLGSGGTLNNIVEDISPQLGANLDRNGFHIVGASDLELLKFVEIGGAVNELTVTNAATGNAPSITATGGDTDIDLKIAGKGTGNVLDKNDEFILGRGADIIMREVNSGSGGNFTSGAWRKRSINTEVLDKNGENTLTSDVFVLDAGVWFVKWRTCGFRCNGWQSRLQNTTAPATLSEGTTGHSSTSAGALTWCYGSDEITVAASQNLEIQSQCETTRNTDGFGPDVDFIDNIRTVVELWRLS